MDLHTAIKTVGDHETVRFASRELERLLSSIPGMTVGDGGSSALTFGTYADLGRADVDIDPAGRREDAENQREDSVTVRTVDEGGRICGYVAGATPRAVLLATYRLLHALGFRFPDPCTEVIPDAAAVRAALPVEIDHTPPYRHRGICIEGAVSEEHVAAIVDWAPKVGFNGYFIQFREGHTFFDRWYAPRLERSLTRQEAGEIVARVVSEVKLRDLDYHAVGHGWTCEPFGLPGLGWETHTEEIPPDVRKYLAEIDGERNLWGGIALNTNLCYSSVEVQRRMAEAVADYAADHSEIDYLHVWLADGTNNNCECPACRNTRPSDFYVQILNRIDSLLSERDNTTKIVFLAYVDLFWPPEQETIENPDRFVLMFAPITRSYSSSFRPNAPLPDPEPFDRNNLTFPKSVEGNLACLAAWQKQFDGDSFDFDYHMMWDHYSDPGYAHMARILHEDIVNLRAIGLNGYMSCQVQRAFFPTGLCMYVMGETLWDTDRDFDEIASEYYSAAFGDAAEEVSEYLAGLSTRLDPEYLRGERDLSRGDAESLLEEAIRYLDDHRELTEAATTDGVAVLDSHRRLTRIVAEALLAGVREDRDSMIERWEAAKRLIEGFDDAVLDRFDDHLFRNVARRRILGLSSDEE